MRGFSTIFFLLTLSSAVLAAEMPDGQVPIRYGQVLRGQFVEENQMDGNPIQSSGHFVVAPGHGLIWGIEQPFPTTTIVTPKGSAQDFGGIAVKLPIKNLQHLYAMIGGALTGDWSGLEMDYAITGSSKDGRWQMLLTPRNTGSKPVLSYASITVSGARFVEHIVLMRRDGRADTLDFANEVLTEAPLTASENLAFNEVGQ